MQSFLKRATWVVNGRTGVTFKSVFVIQAVATQATMSVIREGTQARRKMAKIQLINMGCCPGPCMEGVLVNSRNLILPFLRN